MKKLLYDVGELGWSLVISAHLNLLKENNGSEYVGCTYPERVCLYSGSGLEMANMPEQLRFKYSQLDQDGTHLYNHETKTRVWHDILTRDFRVLFNGEYMVAGPEEYAYQKITSVKPFRFMPTELGKNLVELRFKDINKIILVFPRRRVGKFASRNLDYEFYVKLCRRLCFVFQDYTVINFGSKKGAYQLNVIEDLPNFIDLVRESDSNKLDLLIALCDSGKVKFAVGSQSAPPKISLIMGVPTFMIGHEKHRHTVTDNWMGTKVDFFEPISYSNGCYLLPSEMVERCLSQIREFGENL